MLSSILAIHKYKNAEFYGIIINYGQIPFENELDKVENFCNKFNIKLHIIDIKNLFKSGTVKGENYNEISEGQLSDIYTPLRNLVIGAAAASLAEAIGASVIVTGSKTLNIDRNNPWSFSDSTLGFYTLFNSLLTLTLLL
jgi:7-cyano-7-deazaguanine synthase in queuosine biosynthesis